MKIFDKDPQAVKPYPVVLYSWLEGDTLSTASVTATGTVVVDSDNINAAEVTIGENTYPANTVIMVWLSGGTLDETCTVTALFTTVGGMTDRKSFQVYIANQ